MDNICKRTAFAADQSKTQKPQQKAHKIGDSAQRTFQNINQRAYDGLIVFCADCIVINRHVAQAQVRHKGTILRTHDLCTVAGFKNTTGGRNRAKKADAQLFVNV